MKKMKLASTLRRQGLGICISSVLFAIFFTSVQHASAQQALNVLLDENFDRYKVGAAPRTSALRRMDNASVVNASPGFGSGRAVRMVDDGDGITALEYVLGGEGSRTLYIEFDFINNREPEDNGSSSLIFSVGPWNASDNTMLNSKKRRAFGVEFYQRPQKKNLKLRAGESAQVEGVYSFKRSQNIKVWVNASLDISLSYQRPDGNGDGVLAPNSFVVWLDNQLVLDEKDSGLAMYSAVSNNNLNLGRIGFNSTTRGRADFTIDNLQVVDPASKAVSTFIASNEVATAAPTSINDTPDFIDGGQAMHYYSGSQELNVFVFKPKDWKPSDKRSAMMYFFGGGWTRGTPKNAASWARWAAKQGMVGIAPDYRTFDRFGTSPLESVADGRAALRWLEENAQALGIDPQRIAVGGNSAGGHLALWTAISATPPGSDPQLAPAIKPAAVFVSSAVSDTSVETGYTPERFGENARALSPVHQLDASMPPLLMFHARDDQLVDYSTAVTLCETLKATGNYCDLTTVPAGGHNYNSQFPIWKRKVRSEIEDFLFKYNLIPAEARR